MDRTRGITPAGRPGMVVPVAVWLILLWAAPLEAQNGWLGRARDLARKTELGKSVSRTTLEAQLLDAPAIPLEEAGLATLPVGSVILGVAQVEISDGAGVRLRAYLYNPTAEPVTLPLPDREIFVLIDEKGRQLERLAGPDFEGVATGAAEVVIPGLERVTLALLFGGVAGDARLGILKVGTIGMIPGIPVHTSAAPTAGGATNVWHPPGAAAHPAGAPPLPDTGRVADGWPLYLRRSLVANPFHMNTNGG